MHRALRRLRSLRGTRLAAAVAVATVAVAGIVFGAVESFGGAAATDGAPTRATSVADVVARVRNSFGDRQIVSASLDGSVLSVALEFPGSSKTPGYGVKGVFEAQVLGGAVADWMRAHGREPITTVRYRKEGKVIPGWSAAGNPVESDPHVPPLAADACDKAAEAGRTAPLTLVSAQTLPYLDGTCVFTIEAADLRAGSGEAMSAVARMVHAIGPPNERPWLFELDDRNGVPRSGASWMPSGGGTTWTSPGLAYPLAHG